MVIPSKSRVASRYLQAHGKQVTHVAMSISKNLIQSFEPYVKDPEDADIVADRVWDSFCGALDAKFARVQQELKIVKFSTDTNTQTFGFEQDHGYSGKTSLWGTVSYPEHCHMMAAWKINTEKRWQDALKVHAREFKPSADYLSIPVPQVEITKYLTEDMGNWGLPSNNYPIPRDMEETVEQAMYRSPEFDDTDHDTEHTDYEGNEIDSDHGETPRYDFGFRVSKFPVVTVSYTQPQALVKLELTIDIHLKDVISPWDRHYDR